jgi:hypothetical protein
MCIPSEIDRKIINFMNKTNVNQKSKNESNESIENIWSCPLFNGNLSDKQFIVNNKWLFIGNNNNTIIIDCSSINSTIFAQSNPNKCEKDNNIINFTPSNNAKISTFDVKFGFGISLSDIDEYALTYDYNQRLFHFWKLNKKEFKKCLDICPFDSKIKFDNYMDHVTNILPLQINKNIIYILWSSKSYVCISSIDFSSGSYKLLQVVKFGSLEIMPTLQWSAKNRKNPLAIISKEKSSNILCMDSKSAFVVMGPMNKDTITNGFTGDKGIMGM